MYNRNQQWSSKQLLMEVRLVTATSRGFFSLGLQLCRSQSPLCGFMVIWGSLWLFGAALWLFGAALWLFGVAYGYLGQLVLFYIFIDVYVFF